MKIIESIKDYSVLFVGHTIIDEYRYVTPLGKSPKENIIPMKYERQEVFAGGVQAAAEHLKTFCREVAVSNTSKAMRKTRYVDMNYLRKLAEVHYEEPDMVNVPRINPDVVAVTDFGYSTLPIPQGKFTAINCQTNSDNVGFNLITKYEKADYVVLDEYEARLAAHDRDSEIEVVMKKLAEGRFRKMVVTLGNKGAVGWDGESLHRAPAFTDKPIDTMGAGDAFFAVTAPMAKTGSMPDLLKIGNAAGALKTQIIGHRASVTKQALIEFLHANHIS